MNSGIVMEVSNKHIIVMTREGLFERLPARNRSCQVGEEITYAPLHSRFRYPALSTVSIFTAAVMFCLILLTTLPGLFADKTVVAYVSIDINPSVEVGIDGKKIVREASGLNDQGTELIRALKFKGKTISEFAEALLQKAEEKQYLKQGEGDIVIASTVINDGAKVNDNLLSEDLKQQVLTHFVKKYPGQSPDIEVTAFAAPKEVREEAKQHGLSPGKYAVYLGAKSAGLDLKLDDFKTDSVHNIAKENGGIGKLVDGSKLKKDSIKELLQEEKDGSLDKQLEESKKKKEEESKKQGKSNAKPANPSPKPGPSVTPAPKPSASTKPKQNPGGASRQDDVRKQDNNDKETNSSGKKTAPEPAATPREQDDGKKDQNKQDEKKDTEKKDSGKKNNKKDTSMLEEKIGDLARADDLFTEEKADPTQGDHVKEANQADEQKEAGSTFIQPIIDIKP